VAKRRLSGEPDKQGRFVNLKQLREYVLKNKVRDLSRFSFDVQASSRPTLRGTDLEATLEAKERLWKLLSIIFAPSQKILAEFLDRESKE
jgi:hypothetical protein